MTSPYREQAEVPVYAEKARRRRSPWSPRSRTIAFGLTIGLLVNVGVVMTHWGHITVSSLGEALISNAVGLVVARGLLALLKKWHEDFGDGPWEGAPPNECEEPKGG